MPIYRRRITGFREKTSLHLDVTGYEAIDALRLVVMKGLRNAYLLVHLQEETLDSELIVLSAFFKTLLSTKDVFNGVTIEVPDLPRGKEVDLIPTLWVVRTQFLKVRGLGTTARLLYLPEPNLGRVSTGTRVRTLDFDKIDLSSGAMQHLIRTVATENSITRLCLTFCGRHYTLAGLFLPKLESLSVDAAYGLSGILTFIMRHQQSLAFLTVHDTPSLLDGSLHPRQLFRLPSLQYFRGTAFVFEQLVSKLIEFPSLNDLTLDSDSTSLTLKLDDDDDDRQARQIYLAGYDKKLFDWLTRAMEVTDVDLEIPEKTFRSHFGPDWAGSQFTQVKTLKLRQYDLSFSIEEIVVSDSSRYPKTVSYILVGWDTFLATGLSGCFQAITERADDH